MALRHTVTALAILLLAKAPAAVDAAPVPPQRYTLQGDSHYLEGCFPPCLCPVRVGEPLRGSFGLRPAWSPGWQVLYRVVDVTMNVPYGDALLTLRGSGTYRQALQVGFVQRMELNLSVNGGSPQHFDSGWVPGFGGLERLQLALSVNGLECYDTALVLDARRVSPHQTADRLRTPPGLSRSSGTAAPRIETVENSGCLMGVDPGDGMWCDEDTVTWTASPGRITGIHRQATYNCCADDITVTLDASGHYLRLDESEQLTVPCDCLCCYDVTATVSDVPTGTYIVDWCWVDDTAGPTCRSFTLSVP